MIKETYQLNNLSTLKGVIDICSLRLYVNAIIKPFINVSQVSVHKQQLRQKLV